MIIGLRESLKELNDEVVKVAGRGFTISSWIIVNFFLY
jgi:hypothetical protein